MSEINPKYLEGLTPSQKLLQMRLLRKSQAQYEKTGEVSERPAVSEAKPRRSKWVVQFEKRYGFPITDLAKVKAQFPKVDVDGILAKGAAAYMSSGSRPNVGSYAWKYARLASALLGGPAAKIDKKELGNQ